jgi:hypothetical protein
MAHIEMTMQAVGVLDAEKCAGCEKAFARGETMSAVVAESGEPLGWYCSPCIAEWRVRSQKTAESTSAQRSGVEDGHPGS